MAIVFPHLSVNFDVLAHQRSDVADVAQMIGKDDRGERTFGMFGAKVDVLEAARAGVDFLYLAGDAARVADLLGCFGDGDAGRGGDVVEKEKREDESKGGQDIILSAPCAGRR